MHRKAYEYLRKLAEKTDISADTLLGEPTVVLAGYRELWVDRHKSILEYSDEKIVIALHRGVLTVSGTELRLKQMVKERLAVRGKITGLTIEESI